MSATHNPNRVIWIESPPRRPLCDVPWFGTAVVHSDGRVNFCCYSSAVVGDVNRQSFDEVWNGPEMREIRHALSERRLPSQCQSGSCPFYRGDESHYIFDRMDGAHSLKATGTHDPHARVRERFQASRLRVDCAGAQVGAAPDVSLEFFYRGEPLKADLFIAIRCPDGIDRFLPDLDDYAVPFEIAVEFSEDHSPLRIDLLEQAAECFQGAGEYQVCAALFEPESNPNLISNCYWSASQTVILNQRAG